MLPKLLRKYYANIIRLSSLILIWKWQTFCAVFAVSFPESKTDSNPNLKKECIQSTMLPSARRASSFVHCKKKLSSHTNHKRKRGSGSELKHPGSSTLIVWNYSDYYGFWLLIHKVSCDRAGMANECGSANNQLQKPFCGQPKVPILSLSRPRNRKPAFNRDACTGKSARYFSWFAVPSNYMTGVRAGLCSICCKQ